MKINFEDKGKKKNTMQRQNFSYPESNNICYIIYSNISLLFTCIVGYFSHIYSTNSYYYRGDDECELLKNWVYAFSIYCFILIAKEALYLSISFLECLKLNIFSGLHLLTGQLVFFILSTIASAILNIGITFVLFKYEPCGSCRTLAIFLVIFYWIKTTLACCILLCCCRYCGFSSLKNSIIAISGKNDE